MNYIQSQKHISTIHKKYITRYLNYTAIDMAYKNSDESNKNKPINETKWGFYKILIQFTK